MEHAATLPIPLHVHVLQDSPVLFVMIPMENPLRVSVTHLKIRCHGVLYDTLVHVPHTSGAVAAASSRSNIFVVIGGSLGAGVLVILLIVVMVLMIVIVCMRSRRNSKPYFIIASMATGIIIIPVNRC